MFVNIIFLILFVAILWVINVNVVRSETDKIEAEKDMYVNNTEIIITKYERHLFKNVIIGVTPWGGLCSINDTKKEFEFTVEKYMNMPVRVYYKTFHRGIIIFGETNEVVRITPIYKN